MYDLLLSNGRVIDPSQELDRCTNIAFQDGKVSAIDVSADSPTKQMMDVTDCLVTPGLIDLHTHIYWGGTSIGVDPNKIAQQSGCTTLVDAGTAGAGNVRGFHQHVIEPARPRILAFLNIAFPGIYAFSQNVMVGECSDLRLLSQRDCLKAAQSHSQLIVGIKARVGHVAGGASGVAPLDMALEVATEAGVPVMAHLDFPPPSREEVLNRLREGDILTHCYRPFPNAPVSGAGDIYREVMEARDRGVIFDIGHGMGSFAFKTARLMLEKDVLPDTISSDVHDLCRGGPAYDLLVTMTKFMALGMPLDQIIERTTLAPAQALRRPDLGTLKPGMPADASVLQIQNGSYSLEDCVGEKILARQKLLAKGTVVEGRWQPSESTAELPTS